MPPTSASVGDSLLGNGHMNDDIRDSTGVLNVIAFGLVTELLRRLVTDAYYAVDMRLLLRIMEFMTQYTLQQNLSSSSAI